MHQFLCVLMATIVNGTAIAHCQAPHTGTTITIHLPVFYIQQLSPGVCASGRGRHHYNSGESGFPGRGKRSAIPSDQCATRKRTRARCCGVHWLKPPRFAQAVALPWRGSPRSAGPLIGQPSSVEEQLLVVGDQRISDQHQFRVEGKRQDRARYAW